MSFRCTYAPAAAGGPRLLGDGGSSSQRGLCSLWHRWFRTYWSPRGTWRRRSPETKGRFRPGLTTRRGLLRRARVWFINRASGRPAFWNGGLGLACWEIKRMKKLIHNHFWTPTQNTKTKNGNSWLNLCPYILWAVRQSLPQTEQNKNDPNKTSWSSAWV